jgi:hypothetical protein
VQDLASTVGAALTAAARARTVAKKVFIVMVVEMVRLVRLCSGYRSEMMLFCCEDMLDDAG